MPPTVSINLCCYNSEKYLRETLDSIVNQTYKDWELVIINDGSSDSTESIIYEYIEKGCPITYHYQSNHGLGYSRNEAVRRSSGEYIAFVDHDDIWMPNKLQKQIPLFDNANVGLVFSSAYYFNGPSNDCKKFNIYEKRKPPRGKVFGNLLEWYWLCLSTVVIRKRAFDVLGTGFDSIFKVSEEVDVFFRMAYKWELDYADEPLVMYRVHEHSSTFRISEAFSAENELILSRLISNYPEIKSNFRKQLDYYRSWIQYMYVIEDLKQGRTKKARDRLVPYLQKNKKLCLLYILSFLPFKYYTFLTKTRDRLRP